jgi:hypothetical protein
MWKFYVGKTQVFKMGFPGASVIKFVQIDEGGHPIPLGEKSKSRVRNLLMEKETGEVGK